MSFYPHVVPSPSSSVLADLLFGYALFTFTPFSPPPFQRLISHQRRQYFTLSVPLLCHSPYSRAVVPVVVCIVPCVSMAPSIHLLAWTVIMARVRCNDSEQRFDRILTFRRILIQETKHELECLLYHSFSKRSIGYIVCIVTSKQHVPFITSSTLFRPISLHHRFIQVASTRKLFQCFRHELSSPCKRHEQLCIWQG